jgi:hypothetical protein
MEHTMQIGGVVDMMGRMKQIEDLFVFKFTHCRIDLGSALDPLYSSATSRNLDSAETDDSGSSDDADGDSGSSDDTMGDSQDSDDTDGDFGEEEVGSNTRSISADEEEDSVGPNNSRINLNFLDGLKVPDDSFIPDSLYVRTCMRNVVDLFLRDTLNNVDVHKFRTVLIGSPGVGKSILFFLAALFNSRRKGAIYYRVALESEKEISVFVIFPHEGNEVDVLFTRSLDSIAVENVGNGTLSVFHSNLVQLLNVSRKAYHIYLDGPLHNDEKYTLAKSYEYFCTSGGYPPPKSGGLGKLRLWVLDGWTKEEALVALAGNDEFGDVVHPDQVKNAFRLCGGNIREIIMTLSGPAGEREVRNKLDIAIGRTLKSEVKLALESTTRSDLTGDRVRTMFRLPESNDGNVMKAIHVVDSQYILNRLRQTLDVGQFVESYRFGESLNNRALQGLHFEVAVHQYFENTAFGTIEFHRSAGTAKQGVAELVSPNVYWVPSIPNFPNIDSAIVWGGTLHVLQMTIKRKHGFKLKTFAHKFVTPVRSKVLFQNQVSFHIVVPNGSSFDLGRFQRGIDGALRRFQGNQYFRSFFPNGTFSIVSSLVHVDMSSAITMEASLQRQLPFLE